MKIKLTNEQKRLFDSLAEDDASVRQQYEFIWDKSKKYDPNITVNKDKAYTEFLSTINNTPTKDSSKTTTKNKFLISAIIIAFLTIGGYLIYTNFFKKTSMQSTDEIYYAQLEDGSKVWLNSNSQLTMDQDFMSSNRKVFLTGEAFFDIAKNASLPFEIHLKENNVVTVIGTEFNVNSRNDVVEVSVAEGKVNLKNIEKKNLNINLSQGEVGIIDLKNELATKENSLFKSNAWKEDKLLFQNAELYVALQDIGIFYGFEIIFDSSKPMCPLTMQLDRSESENYVFQSIQKIFPNVELKKSENKTYIFSGSCE